MNIKEYRTQFIQELTSIYDAGEAESFFYLILEEKQQLKRIDLALHPDLVFSEEEIGVWNAILEQLKQEIPIQYLLGKTSFFGLDFEVNAAVLIPRPETEELVEWILESQKSKVESQKVKILDIGTGSGCIAISLAKNLPDATVFALDVSEEALATDKKNAKNNPNIAAIAAYLKKNYGQYVIGFSDHTIGISAPVVAVGMGAKIIEKHITIDRNMKGTDQAGSLGPDGVYRMLRDIRVTERSLGIEDIYIEEGVISAKHKLERSIATNVSLKKGDVIKEEHLHLLSPGDGYKWSQKDEIIGKKVIKDIPQNELFYPDFIE